MAKYGKTYWGAQFLNALENIDFSNRLPRGRSYASNGSVRSITIDKNKIEAKVIGSRPNPYDIDIIVPEFTENQKLQLLDAIQSNPTILATLLNRQLPEDLLQIALNKGVQIFPREWKDFSMNCSCPDWAVPCKHLAAVIYLIANEIDLNPFKVLELHGLDVIKELTKQGVEIENSASEKIESWDEFFTKKPSELLESISIGGLDELDFTVIPKYDDKFLNLLSPNPPFYEKNFKSELLTHFKYVSKNVSKHSFNLHGKKTTIDIQNCIKATIVSNKIGEEFLVELVFEYQVIRISLIALFQIFNDTENFKLSQVSDSIKVLYYYFLFAKKIVEQGAVIPQLIVFNDTYQIHWLPLLQDASVKLQVEILNRYFSYINIIQENGKKLTYYSNQEQFSVMLSSIFTTKIVDDIISQSSKIPRYDPVLSLFFGVSYTLKQINKEIFNAIQLWLNKIHSHKRLYIPVLEVAENYPEFSVGLQIRTNSKDKIEAPIPFHQFKKKHKSQLLSVTKDLVQLQEHFPEFNTILNNDDKQIISYKSDKFANFLLQIIPVLNLLGVEILIPKSLKSIIKPAASLKVKSNGPIAGVKTYMDLSSLLNFEWQVAVGDELLSEKEFIKLVKGMDGIVKIKDHFIHVSKEELDKLLKHLQSDNKLSKHQMLQVLFANEYQGEKIEISEEIQKILRQFNNSNPIPLPIGLQGQLRPYQLRGFEWMYKNSKIGFGSILADDMGLGKTLQTIAILLKLKEEQILKTQKALVIVPTTLLTNWGKEMQKFAPGLTYLIYHGNKRNINEFIDKDILLTSYGTARSDAEVLNKHKWQILIIDEAQNIKNHNTDQTKAIKSIHSNVKIALSGTPVENRLSEYWSIFDFTNKGYLGSIKNFNDEFTKPITIERSHKQLDVFKKITSPFIMRRMKSDKSIISDLPDKIENNQYSILTKQQAALYESTVKSAMKIIESSEGIERKGMVLKMMIALKQIGNHPYQYLKTGSNSPELSGKLSVLFELLHAIIDNNEKTLIFTQYKEMGDLLQILIRDELKTEPLFLHGSLTRQQREKLVEDFQTKAHRKIFILSLKAGGTGLNLTQAQNVIHYDLWWNPAVETQATDRAYRIGQKNKVIVHRLINKGTLEERIDEMIRDKKDLANLTVSSGEKWLGELSNKELKDLVRLSNDL
ncbi:MAG: DEAD/DEAH box helicase [Bacteroidales bacterium]|nr:DEAD/DEAH box helicase [Bacteroidales bacterium]